MGREGNSSLEITIDQDMSIVKSRSIQASFKKIFLNMIKESHMIASIVYETLRPFPRFIRGCLLFTELYLELFFSCLFACL